MFKLPEVFVKEDVNSRRKKNICELGNKIFCWGKKAEKVCFYF